MLPLSGEPQLRRQYPEQHGKECRDQLEPIKHNRMFLFDDKYS